MCVRVCVCFIRTFLIWVFFPYCLHLRVIYKSTRKICTRSLRLTILPVNYYNRVPIYTFLSHAIDVVHCKTKKVSVGNVLMRTCVMQAFELVQKEKENVPNEFVYSHVNRTNAHNFQSISSHGSLLLHRIDNILIQCFTIERAKRKRPQVLNPNM